jgi:phage-related protein
MPEKFTVTPITKNDVEWVKNLFIQYWGGDICVSRGKVQKVDDFTGGFIAKIPKQNAGFITYTITGMELEITNLISLKENLGIGSALVKSVTDQAKERVQISKSISKCDGIHA